MYQYLNIFFFPPYYYILSNSFRIIDLINIII